MSRILAMVRHPAAWILGIAGVVELMTGGTPARGAILFAGALLIFADRFRVAHRIQVGTVSKPPRAGPTAQRFRSACESRHALAVIMVAALVLALLTTHSAALTVAIGLIGLGGVGWAWVSLDETSPGESLARSQWLPWLEMLLALALWELAALLSQPSLEVASDLHPTISHILDPILATYPGRLVGLLLWLLAGRALLKRS